MTKRTTVGTSAESVASSAQTVARTAGTGRPLGVRGARTRQRLLDAAERVFTQLGYHDASVTKIAEAAGVAPGTFYLYFQGKLALFEQLIEDLDGRMRRAMAEASAQATTRADAERLGFRAFFAFTGEHPGLYRLMRQAEFVSPPSLRRHYERIVEGYVRGLAKAMAAGEIATGDPEVLAWALMGVGEMIGMRWILWGPRRQVSDEVFEETMRFVRRALGAS